MRTAFPRIFLLFIHLILYTSLYAQYYGDMYYELDNSNMTAKVSNKVYNGPKGVYNIPAVCNWVRDYRIIGIESRAFGGCEGLTAIGIPSTINSIGSEPFYNCPNLATIRVDESNRWYKSEENVLFSMDGSLIRYAPMKPRKKYVIPSYVTTIYSGAFQDCAYLTSVEIPFSVTTIGYDSFWHCANLDSINVPNSVTSIGSNAFAYCYGLSSVNIPNSVTTIHSGAFEGCKKLKSIEIPNSITSIDERLFHECASLKSVKIPNTVTSIQRYAFCDCHALASIEIPNSITHIGENAFANCSNLKSFNVPASVTSIKSQTFYNCNHLISVEIPNSITSIGWAAFENCSSLKSINLPKSIITIEASAFKGCSSFVSIKIPDGVTSVGSYSFADCKKLTSVEIPKSIKSIGLKAFSGCSALKSIYYNSNSPIECEDNTFTSDLYENATLYVPIGARDEFENVGCWWNFKNIVEYDFPSIPVDSIVLSREHVDMSVNESMSLTAAIFPEDATDKSVTWASNNENVAIVDSNGTVKAIAIGHATISATSGDVTSSCIVNVKPILAQSLSITPDQWSGQVNSSFMIDATILPENTSDKTLTWKSSDVEVASVDTEGNVTVHKTGQCVITVSTVDGSNLQAECSILCFIKDREFSYTYQNQTIVYTVLDEVAKTCKTKEGRNQFNCGNRISGSLILPAEVFDGKEYYTLTSIGANSFCGCGDLTYIDIPETVTVIGDYAFYMCKSISKVEIPESIAYLGQCAFAGCEGLTTINIPDTLSEIKPAAFHSCSNLKRISIPHSVTKIQAEAFQNCTNIESVIFEGEMINIIGQRAFSNCGKLYNIVFPYYVNCIEHSAFRNCSLSKVWLNYEVNRADVDGYGDIDEYAFSGNKITSIYSCSSVPAKLSSTTFDDFASNLYVFDEYKNEYLGSKYKWRDFANIYSLILPESMSVAPKEGSLDRVKPGDQIQLNVTFNPSDTSFKTVYWESTNTDIATVDQNGLVTIIGSSDSDEPCHITAYSLCSLWKASITINSADLDGVEEVLSGNNTETIEVYDFNGIKISNKSEGLPTGLYIVKQGNKVSKLIIK